IDSERRIRPASTLREHRGGRLLTPEPVTQRRAGDCEPSDGLSCQKSIVQCYGRCRGGSEDKGTQEACCEGDTDYTKEEETIGVDEGDGRPVHQSERVAVIDPRDENDREA